MHAQCFEMIGRSIAFVAREAVLWVDGVPLFHAGVAMRFRKDRGRRNGNAASVTLNKGLLLDQDIQLHSVNEQVIGRGRELLKRRGHRLTAGLIDIPGINPLGVDFCDRPCQGMFVNPFSQLRASVGGKFFRIIQADNPPLWVENNCGGNHRAK